MKLRVPGSDVSGEAEPGGPESPRGVVALRDGRFAWVHLRGETWRIERAPERPAGRAGEEEHDLFAPMPGKVVRVLVSEGEEVSRGTPLLLLEAMKMEHEVRSPRAGKVSRLFRAAGEMVSQGDPLVEIA